jgi:pimeloyl-ACP methyl ester carboxylesterase
MVVGRRVDLLERSGHFPFIEEPGLFWSAVGAFLSGGNEGARERRHGRT